MNRYLRRAFAGLGCGDRCTGTVHALRLDSRMLLERGIIRHDAARNEYVFACRTTGNVARN